ncbi:MAG: tyrosine-type recombinase/integrase [Lachnospiraceae bacterium]|nr:tyrosine-type recombinase/integrase [Lachnospiraceae bacterium]
MKQQVTINEFVVMFIDEMRRIGYSEEGIYRDYYRIIRRIARYYELSNTLYYSVETTTEYLSLEKERTDRGEIGKRLFLKIKMMAQKMNEYFITDHLSFKATKHGTVYSISAENERLIDCFISWKKYGTNTCDDVRWVVRKYLYYIEQKLGHTTLEDVTIEEVRTFILETAMDVKASSLHNILIYLKYFHIFLKEVDVPAPDCIDLFSYKVYRDMPVQSYVTDEELDKIISVIDRSTVTGKRDYAIIQLSATTGMRAVDIIHLKLTDINWRKGEVRIVQKKTKRETFMPLVKVAAEAMEDYILNGRPDTEYKEVFLRISPPHYAIQDAASIGDMFKRYQRRAGITRQALDGKGFHGLRRRLAKKLLVSGTPTTSIAQILGHDDVYSVRQYLSLDTTNLKECAMDLSGIPVRREELI